MTSGEFPLIEELLLGAIDDKVFPGCQFAFGTIEELIFGRFGKLGYADCYGEVDDWTLYDLASLTKVLATTLSAMGWVHNLQLDLDQPIGETLKTFQSGQRAKVTLRHLLTHTSGLPAHRDFYKIQGSFDDRWNAILIEPLEAEPGQKVTYSCVGFLVLQKFLEELGKGDVFGLFKSIAKSNPLNKMGFRQLNIDGLPTEFWGSEERFSLNSCAPTEIIANQTIQGIVHDENARSLGGICANAGLFGNATSVAYIARKWLSREIAQIPKSMISEWTQRQSNAGTRAFGWDTKSETGSSAGHLFGLKSFGHTGFTGTSLWIDPEAGIFATLLTNRVHPRRDNTKIIEFRPKFHDAIYRALMY